MHNRTENEMDLNQESTLVLRVLRGHNNRWHVIVDDFRQPLATFEGPHDACAWAIARAKDECGKIFVENIPVDYFRCATSGSKPHPSDTETGGSNQSPATGAPSKRRNPG